MAPAIANDQLARLVGDLAEKQRMCRAEDYPGVGLDQLNAHVREHGPIANPVFGEQHRFAIDDDGRFVPLPMLLYGEQKVVVKIASRLDFWAEHRRGAGGQVLISQGTFTDAPHEVRMPDVSYTEAVAPSVFMEVPRRAIRSVIRGQVDTLSGCDSQLASFDRRMRDEYFPNGVRLGWLIDPHPDRRCMYVYRLDDQGQATCDASSAWRDLHGEDVLPGFELSAATLEMVVSQDTGSSEEEEEKRVDLACQMPGCGELFSSVRMPLTLNGM